MSPLQTRLLLVCLLAAYNEVQALKAWGNPLERVAREAQEAIERAESEASESLEDAGTAVDGLVDEVEEGAKGEVDGVKKYITGKQKMDGIQVFRMMMCLARPDLLAHSECIEFMSDVCSYMTSGEGYCRQYFHFLRNNCRRKGEFQDVACEEVDDLGLETDSNAKVSKDGTKVDTDGDGIPDADDAFPKDPNCQKVGQEGCGDAATETGSGSGAGAEAGAVGAGAEGAAATGNADGTVLAPSPAQAAGSPGAAAPGAAPATSAGAGSAPAPAPAAPTGITKKLRELPVHGFDEHSNTTVLHKDYATMTHDWQQEHGQSEYATEEEAIRAICKQNPDHDWCKLYLRATPG